VPDRPRRRESIRIPSVGSNGDRYDHPGIERFLVRKHAASTILPGWIGPIEFEKRQPITVAKPTPRNRAHTQRPNEPGRLTGIGSVSRAA